MCAMAMVTSSVAPETQHLLPAKPTLSRRATAFSIDAIMATECGKLNHRHVTDDISDSAADVVTSPRGHSVTSPSTRKSTVSGQLSVFVYCIYVSSAACGPVAMKAKLYWVTDALPEAIVPGSDSSSIRLL